MNELVLENSYLKTTILPELGGRVDQLIHKPKNKNWVWKNPNLPNKKVSKFVDYDDNWQGGWEELFPNDAVENFNWGKGLDHGELWSANWDVDSIFKNQISLTTRELESGNIFKKTFQLNKNKLRCEYRSNIFFKDYFLFKLHLAIPIDDELVIHTNSSSIESVDKNFGNILKNKIDFFKLKKNSGLFDFAYIETNKKIVTVEDKIGSTLTLKYGDLNLDYLWIFQSQGGWRKHNVLVLEPASNSKKFLNDAINESKCLQGPLEFACYYEVELN